MRDTQSIRLPGPGLWRFPLSVAETTTNRESPAVCETPNQSFCLPLSPTGPSPAVYETPNPFASLFFFSGYVELVFFAFFLCLFGIISYM